jgi:hypothetical protein
LKEEDKVLSEPSKPSTSKKSNSKNWPKKSKAMKSLTTMNKLKKKNKSLSFKRLSRASWQEDSSKNFDNRSSCS